LTLKRQDYFLLNRYDSIQANIVKDQEATMPFELAGTGGIAEGTVSSFECQTVL